jgi:hypothetical protein
MNLEYLTKDELRKVLAIAAEYGSREACIVALAYLSQIGRGECALAGVPGGWSKGDPSNERS